MVACGGAASTVSPTSRPMTVAAYNYEINKVADSINREMKIIGDGLAIGAFDNPRWQREFTQAGEAMEVLVREAEDLRPPDEFTAFHETWLIALDHYGQFGTLAKSLATSFDSEIRATRLLEELSREKDLGDSNMKFAQSILDKR